MVVGNAGEYGVGIPTRVERELVILHVTTILTSEFDCSIMCQRGSCNGNTTYYKIALLCAVSSCRHALTKMCKTQCPTHGVAKIVTISHG